VLTLPGLSIRLPPTANCVCSGLVFGAKNQHRYVHRSRPCVNLADDVLGGFDNLLGGCGVWYLCVGVV
jgi:hypothetical protein